MRVASRAFVGPLIGGIGAWCALGVVSLPSAVLGTSRIVAPAPLWAAVAAIGLATLVAGWRSQPLTASPALLAVVPWLPLPLPASVLLWSGHVAWVPVGLALLAGLAVTRTAPPTGRASDPSPPPVSSAIAAGIATLVVSIAVAWALAPRLPGGDEPNYLVITQSLLKDGDLAIENNFRDRDYAAYFGGTLAPDYIQRGRGGVIYSIHAPGLPVVVAPLFAAFGYRGAQATVMLLAAVTGALIWAAGWLATRDRGSAWFAWAAVTGSVTFLVQSVTIFPDGPGAAIVALAVVQLLRLGRQANVATRGLVATAASLAALPFLHTRFVTLAVGFGLAFLWALLTESSRAFAERRSRVLAFLAVPLIGAVAWLSYFQMLYGTPNPAVPYGSNPETRLAYAPGGVLGLLFDQQFGLLMYAPVLVMAAWGWLGRASRTDARPGRLALPAVGLYFAAVGSYWMWWAGLPAPPARFAAAILPALGAPIAVAWRQASGAARVAWAAALIGTLAISLLLVVEGRGALAWSFYDAHAAWLTWLESIVNLPRAWPSFFWRLTPGVVASEAPFALHVAACLGVLAIGAGVIGAIGRRGGSAPLAAACAAWTIALGLMLTAQIGWSLTRASAVEPVGDQLRILRRLAARGDVFDVLPWQLPTRHTGAGAITIDVPRVDLPGEHAAAWATLDDLPAGDYDIRASVRRVPSGQLAVRVGRSPTPLRRLGFDSGEDPARVAFRISLPAGADMLVFDPDDRFAAGARTLTVTPVSVQAHQGPLATESWSSADVTVFFGGEGMFLEPDGFWVRGGQSVDLTLADARHAREVRLRLSNGAVANAVAVFGAPGGQTLSLAAGESKVIAVPLDATGTARLGLASTTGFRPSDVGPSEDRRYLGVRVTVER
jgi:hypothetical protein